jgi:hypothetical protein
LRPSEPFTEPLWAVKRFAVTTSTVVLSAIGDKKLGFNGIEDLVNTVHVAGKATESVSASGSLQGFFANFVFHGRDGKGLRGP